MIFDSYVKKRLVVCALIVTCAIIGYFGLSEDPQRATWVGQVAYAFNLGVFPLFAVYFYLWIKGRKDHKNKK